jgi:GNAT superfamily N-acetyltransferase
MTPALRIVIRDDSLLTAADRLSLRELSDAVHPAGSPPNPVTAALEWVDSALRAMAWQEGRMVCHVGALLRPALIDGAAVTVGGIGEVMTMPDARRQGHATAVLSMISRHLIEIERVSFLMLFCAPALYGFYGRCGWRPLATRLLIRRHGEGIVFPLDPPLVRDGQESVPDAGVLDLCGPPW